MKKNHAPTPFSRHLRTEREQRHLLQKQLAIDVGVSQSVVCGWESGVRPPPRGSQLQALIRAIRLSDAEAALMRHLAEISRPTLRLHQGTPVNGYQVLHDLAANLPRMSDQHLQVLAGLLKLHSKEAA